jgi:protein SCO1
MIKRLRFLLCCWMLVTAGTALAVQVPLSQPVDTLANPQAARQVGVDEKLGGQIPLDLTFRDATGKVVRLGDLITVPTVIVPIYYSCPNVCSFLQGALARALLQVQRTPNKDYRVLSVSFNAQETPDDARKARAIYDQAMNHQFPMDAWRFLTGDQAAIDALTGAAGYRFIRQGKDFLHPVAIFVVTKDGKICRYLYGTSILPMDLTLALVEAAQGRVSPAIRKVAQFCFSYDPKNGRYVFNIFRVSATVILLTAGAFLAFLILTGRHKPRESQSKP